MELSWAQTAQAVQCCVDEAEVALGTLYDAYDPYDSASGGREQLREGHTLLADHSHALTTIQDGARCALAVCDAIKPAE